MKKNLVENHINLARKISLNYSKNLEDSDVFGCACLALVEASVSYDPNKGSFSTWATRIIKQKIIKEFRKNKNFDMLGDKDVALVDKNSNKLPYDLIKTIFENNKDENSQILKSHYLDGKTWAEIGRDMNVTRECVRIRGCKALDKIRSNYKVLIEDFELFNFREI